MEYNCKYCVGNCENAGKDEIVQQCKKYKEKRSAVIKTENFYAFPDRIVVESEISGQKKIFVQK